MASAVIARPGVHHEGTPMMAIDSGPLMTMITVVGVPTAS